MDKKTIRLIAILAGVAVALACAAVGIFLLGNKDTEEKYSAAVKKGDRYLAAADYEAAIETYTNAIEIDETDEYAYMQLATAYEACNEMKEVDRILTLGYQRTRSKDIQTMMNNLIAYGSIFGESGATTVYVSESDTAETAVSEAFFDAIIDCGYEDYKEAYGAPSITKSNGGSTVTLTFSGLDVALVYVNGQTEIVDAGTGIPEGNIRPSYVEATDIGSIFEGFDGSMRKSEVETLFDETVQVTFTASYNYILVHYRNCEVYLECDADGNITEDCAWNRIVIPGAGTGETEVTNGGTISGKVIDASTGSTVANVKLTFRAGRGNQSGEVAQELQTGAQGTYEIELTEGYYTVCVEAEGYTKEYFEVNVISGMTLTGQDFTISGELASGEARIVLEWGASPRDLDSYLYYTGSRGNHMVYYGDKKFDGFINLDVDDTDGYGPETITISDISEGIFTFCVNDFLNNSLGMDNTALGTSGATVKVYMPGQSQPTVYNVPEGNGTNWMVFEIKDGKLSTLNSLNAETCWHE